MEKTRNVFCTPCHISHLHRQRFHTSVFSIFHRKAFQQTIRAETGNLVRTISSNKISTCHRHLLFQTLANKSSSNIYLEKVYASKQKKGERTAPRVRIFRDAQESPQLRKRAFPTSDSIDLAPLSGRSTRLPPPFVYPLSLSQFCDCLRPSSCSDFVAA